MTTMYVYNIPTINTVNLRKTASSSGTVLIRVGYGEAVEASASTTSGWHNASYSGYSGYIMPQHLTTSNPNNGSGSYNYAITATVGTVKNGVGGTVKLRKEASTSSAVLTTVGNGQQVLVATLTGEWLPAKYGSNAGFIMGKFVVGAEAYGSGSSNDGTPYEQAIQKIDAHTTAHKTDAGIVKVSDYFKALEEFCNAGWKYGSGYSATNRTIDCAWYPYKARGEQGAHGATSEYTSHLACKGKIATLGGYDKLIPGMEIFQGDNTTKGHMGVYAVLSKQPCK